MRELPNRSLHQSIALVLGIAAATASAQQLEIEEIIVTAEKRATNLQSTAKSISALSGEDLELLQVAEIGGLALSVPNVNFGQTTGNARIAIRGIGFDNLSLGNEGRVAFHVDDLYVSRPAAALANFYDLERVEVLRGPQGFLYGRNATAGAINIITRQPGDEFNGHLSLTGGNYGLIKTQGAVGGPLSDTLGARLAFQVVERDGYGTNQTNGGEIDDESTRAVRGVVTWQPDSRVELNLRADYMEQDDHAYSFRYLGPGSLPDPAVGWPGLPVKGTLVGGKLPDDLRDSTADSGPLNEREFIGVSADLTWALGDYDLKFITGYRSTEFDTTTDLDNTDIPLTIYNQFSDSEHNSQELRLSREGGFGDWMIGGYRFSEDLTAATRGALDPYVVPPLGLPGPVGLRRGGTLIGALETRAWALFGHFRWRLSNAFAVRVGGRYSDEKKSIDELNQLDFASLYPPFGPYFPPTPPGARERKSATWDSFTPSVTLEYQANDDAFLYFDYSQGFKSGGYNVGNLQPAFDPEEIDQYEIGVRADWLQGRLRTNASLFLYDYTELQVSKVNGLVITVENAADSNLYGAELEIIALPTANLRLEASLGLLDTEFKDYSSQDPARPAALFGVFDLTGNELTQAPDYTLNLAAEYLLPMASGDVTLRLDARFVSDVWLSVYNLDHMQQTSYEWFDAQMQYRSRNGRWGFGAFVNNIGNEDVINAALIASALVGSPINGSFAPPRTYGFSVNLQF